MSKKLNCFIDGNALCIVREDFINIQESESVFIPLDVEVISKIDKLGEE